MKPIKLLNYAEGHWYGAQRDMRDLLSAVNGEVVAQAGTDGLDFGGMARYARARGGLALRAMTFHERARMVKSLAEAIMARKDELYELSYATGATKADSWIDIEGGAGTLFTYASKGRRQLPNDTILMDGDPEIISKRGTFLGQHVYTSRQGVAVHINAYNFPIWGMLEKLGPTLLAGVPAIVKPGTDSAWLTEACFRIMIESGVLPEGALQLIVGPTGDLLNHLTMQDVISFTGSAQTASKLRHHPTVLAESVPFIAECDSLNSSILGPDAVAGTPEFDLFVKEVAREMTTKAGQKCTAIRRAFVPASQIDAVQAALFERLAAVKIGDPRLEGVTMGALAGLSQRQDVRDKVGILAKSSRIVFGDPDHVDVVGGNDTAGAFLSPILLRSDTPWDNETVHDVEAFGPVSTLMPYTDFADVLALANRGKGSLVTSLFTHEPAVARELVLGAGAYHGRIVIIDRDCARESTGHGSPLPGLVHGGPGRAGGSEEMGGLRGVKHYMQRTALQGGPATLSAIVGQLLPGAPRPISSIHPFRKTFSELAIGDTVETSPREITLVDIEHFAAFTGDTFYAHMDEEAAAANPFFPGRVAHGYLLLSFAAGLFVDPAPGPVLANYGLESLRFVKPVVPGDSIRVSLSVKSKAQRKPEYGEVRWAVAVTNQADELVASYDLLTMNAL